MCKGWGAAGPAAPWQAESGSGCGAASSSASGQSAPAAGSPVHPYLPPLTLPGAADEKSELCVLFFPPPSFFFSMSSSYLFSPEVQALVVELADQVPPQDVGVDLQQGAQVQTERGPPLSLGATRGEGRGAGARG